MTFIRHLAEKTSEILLHHQVKEAVATNMVGRHIPAERQHRRQQSNLKQRL